MDWTGEDLAGSEWIRSDFKIEALLGSPDIQSHLAPEDQGKRPPKFQFRQLDLNRFLVMHIPPHVPDVQMKMWHLRAAHERESGGDPSTIERLDRICEIMENRAKHGDLTWVCAQTQSHFYNFLVDLDAKRILLSIWGHPLFTAQEGL